MSDIALQIERVTSGTLASGANVIFDTTVFSSGNISYNNLTGVITFNEAGRYAVNWWVATQSSPSTAGSVFALSSSQGDFLEGSSPIKTSEVVGFGIIDVVAAPVTLSLVNASSSTAFYSPIVPVTATLVIIEDDIGVTGPTGPTGDAGPTGDTGPTGATNVTTFGYVYELATIVDATVLGGADVPFSNNGPLSGVTHTAGTTTIIVPEAGIYQIDYYINITVGLGSAIAIAVNGTVDASTNISALVAVGEISGTAMLTLAAGDVITLRNNSAVPFTMNLAPGIGSQLDIIILA